MKLSTAILKGSKLKPQCFGGMHKDNGSCALGAAADAVELKDIRFLDDPLLLKEFPILEEVIEMPMG